MATNFSITLPTLPVATGLLSLDSSGNMAVQSYQTAGDNVGTAMTATGADAIAATMTSTGANDIANTRTRAVGSTVGIGGVAISSPTSNTGSTNVTFAEGVKDVGISVTITTTGRPVVVSMLPDNSSTAQAGALIDNTASGSVARVYFMRDGSTQLGGTKLGVNSTEAPDDSTFPLSFSIIDTPAAGTYTYTANFLVDTAGMILYLYNQVIVAYEL